jgi:hypothetical protein
MSTTTFKYGGGSISGAWARNNKARTFPQSVGVSFSIWIYLLANTGNNNPLFGIGGVGAGPSDTIYMTTSGSSGAWNIKYNVDGTNGTLNWSLANNTWYHIGWTISPAAFGASCTYAFYLNGSVQTTVSGTYPTNVSRIYSDIMSYPGNGGTTLMYVDCYRNYERTLNANEVSYIYSTLDALGNA